MSDIMFNSYFLTDEDEDLTFSHTQIKLQGYKAVAWVF